MRYLARTVDGSPFLTKDNSNKLEKAAIFAALPLEAAPVPPGVLDHNHEAHNNNNMPAYSSGVTVLSPKLVHVFVILASDQHGPN